MTEINSLEHTQKKKKQIVDEEKEVTWKFDKVEVFNCNFSSFDIQILGNLFTSKCFRKVFLVWN